MWGAQGTWNQWALQPSMFNNVPHDEIDWAALAKQWIQMQNPRSGGDGIPSGHPQPEPSHHPPLPPPTHVDYSRDDISHMSFGSDHQFPSDHPEILNPPGVLPDPVPNYESRNVDEGYWARPEWESAAPTNVPDDRVWSSSAPPPPPPPAALPIIPAEKKTFDYGHVHDNPAMTMQTVDYNHIGPDQYYNQMYVPPPPQEDPYDQYWSQVGSVGSAPVVPSNFLKKDRTNDFSTEEDISHIDAAKRKQLPAWIREGLEKMEQERLKRLEKERTEKEQAERAKKNLLDPLKKGLLEESSFSVSTRSKFDSDSDNEPDEPAPQSPKVWPPPSFETKSRVSPPPEELSEEEKRQQLMLKVRRFLTEILLSVTNSEMAAIAKEVHLKALSKAPARPLATTSALRSIATGLHSLASYESHSDRSESESGDSDSSTSDEELWQRIQEKKKKFASKERKILAELEEAEVREQRKNLIVQENRNAESVCDPSKIKNSGGEKSEHEIESNSSSLNSNTQLLNPRSMDQPNIDSYVKNDSNRTLDANETIDENGNSKPNIKSREESMSSDSESDSSLSSSVSTDRSNTKKQKAGSLANREVSRDSKRRKQNRSPRHKHEKRKSSRQDESNEIRSSRSNSVKKKHRSRSKKRSKDKYDRNSDSSQSSHSSNSQYKTKEHKSSERSHHRSDSSDYYHRQHSYSRYRSPSPSKHRKSRSRSRSRKESHPEKYKSSRHYEEMRSKKESRRSRSRSSSYTPKHYRRKSRSVSAERSRHYKKSKISSRDR